MLTFSSKPISNDIELKYNQSKITIKVPRDPYSLLNCPKLLTNAEKPKEEMTKRIVARVDPAEKNFHLVRFAGER